MRSILNLILYSQIVLTACSCASMHVPYVQQSCKSQLGYPISRPSSNWSLDSLEPDENLILIKRKVIPISIHMETTGEGSYVLQLSDNRRKFRSFVLKMTGTSEEINFSGNIKWYIRVKGKSENIVVGLYLIETTKSGKTEVKTLLKQYQLEYGVRRIKNKII